MCVSVCIKVDVIYTNKLLRQQSFKFVKWHIKLRGLSEEKDSSDTI